MKSSKEVMSRNIVSLRMEDSMLEAYRLMYDKGIRHLPIFDEQKNLLGILSDRDVQRAMITDRGDDCPDEIYLNPEKKIMEYMSRPAFTVMEDSPITEVILSMISRKFSAVMVENKRGEYTGIITSEDLLNCMLSLLNREEEIKNKPLSFFMPNIVY